MDLDRETSGGLILQAEFCMRDMYRMAPNFRGLKLSRFDDFIEIFNFRD